LCFSIFNRVNTETIDEEELFTPAVSCWSKRCWN